VSDRSIKREADTPEYISIASEQQPTMVTSTREQFIAIMAALWFLLDIVLLTIGAWPTSLLCEFDIVCLP